MFKSEVSDGPRMRVHLELDLKENKYLPVIINSQDICVYRKQKSEFVL